MAAPTDSQQYLRVKSGGTGGFRDSGNGIEAESVQDMLNNMHPAVATLHAMFEQPSCDSVQPSEVIDYHDIDRTSSAAAVTSLAIGPGASTTIRNAKYPTRLKTRLQTFHEGVAASRESQQIRLYGVTDALDYGIDNLLVRHMDVWERILHFQTGTEDATGSGGTPANPVPRTQGLLSWAAWTGLERRNGSGVPTVVGDGIQAIAKTYWTSFFDASGTPLSRDLFYNQILGPAWSLGHDTDGIMALIGQQLANNIAEFNFVPGRGVINERQIPARDQAIEDIVTVIHTPANGTIYFVVDRYMSIEGANVTYDNTGGSFVGGTGTVNKTVYVDETLLTVMPEKFKIQTMQGISWKELSSDGDYVLGMLVAQKGLGCEHPFAIAGATNLRP